MTNNTKYKGYDDTKKICDAKREQYKHYKFSTCIDQAC